MNDPDLDTLNLNDLMMFDASNDRIEPTDLLDMGQSELIGRIANRWGVSIDEVLLMNELQDGDGGVDLGEVYGRWYGWYEGDRFETVIIWVMANFAMTGY